MLFLCFQGFKFLMYIIVKVSVKGQLRSATNLKLILNLES